MVEFTRDFERFDAGTSTNRNPKPASSENWRLHSDGIIRSNDGRREVKLPDFLVVDLGLSFSGPRNNDSRVTHTVSFNIKNLFDEDYLAINRRPGDPRGYHGRYSIRF